MNPKTLKLSHPSSPLPYVNHSFPFGRLPYEIKERIFWLIFPGNPFKLGRLLASVCCEWRMFSKDEVVLPSFSMQIDLFRKYYPRAAWSKYKLLTPSPLGAILSYFKQIIFLDLGGIDFRFEVLEKILKDCRSVLHLRFDMFDLNDLMVDKLNKLCPKLKKLELWDIEKYLTHQGVLALMNFNNMIELSFQRSFDLKPIEILQIFNSKKGNNASLEIPDYSKFTFHIKK